MNLSKIPSKEIMPGYHGKMVHTKKMTLVFWNVDQEAVVPEHHHAHEQIMHVIEGAFEFTLNGVTNMYHSGDIIPIASNLPHSGKAITPCKLMDVFCPPRDAYK